MVGRDCAKSLAHNSEGTGWPGEPKRIRVAPKHRAVAERLAIPGRCSLHALTILPAQPPCFARPSPRLEVRMKPHNILIGLPAYGGKIDSGCAKSLFTLQSYLGTRKISANLVTVDHADVVMSRNFLACYMLDQDKYSHLLFVDSDMSFLPAAVTRMIDAEKQLIGCVYPKRTIDLGPA